MQFLEISSVNTEGKLNHKEITTKKHELENKTSYSQTHGASKDK